MTDREIADRVRALLATPGMDDPAWVDDQLRQRRQLPFAAGQALDPNDPVEATALLNVRRWYVLGTGQEPAAGVVITAADINRGRLVQSMLKDEGDATRPPR